MNAWRAWRADKFRPGRSTWREFFADPDNRAAVLNVAVHAVLEWLSSVLPAWAVALAVREVTGYGSHSPGVDFVIWASSSALGIYVYFRISRWHDRQDRLDRERSQQEN